VTSEGWREVYRGRGGRVEVGVFVGSINVMTNWMRGTADMLKRLKYNANNAQCRER